MRQRWRFAVSLNSIAGLMFLCGSPDTSTLGEELRAAAHAGAATEGTDWTLRIEPNATFRIHHKGVAVIELENCYWGGNWQFASPSFQVKHGPDGQPIIVGAVPGLKLKVAAAINFPSANKLEMDFEFHASENLTGVIGGGWHWKFKLDSPSFGGRLPDPVLLPGQRGWTWQTGPGQAVTLRFEDRAAKVYYEANRRNTIRTFFFADRVDAGTRRVRVTLQLPEGSRRVLSPAERYTSPDTSRWFRDALTWNDAPVNLSFLNRDDRPAGRHGVVKTEGEHLVFADGTPARLWGANLAAHALFSTPRENVRARRTAWPSSVTT